MYYLLEDRGKISFPTVRKKRRTAVYYVCRKIDTITEEHTMSFTDFLTESTYPDPSAVVTLAALRRRYRDETGEPIGRTAALLELAAAGVPVAPTKKGLTVIAGRAWTPPRHWTIQDGRAVKATA
jgi:hypothetical protein